MKILLIGFGSIGRRHFRNLLALGERDIILYRTGRSTLPDEEIAEANAQILVETDLAAALAHHPQAAIIANPTALHLQTAIPAAQAGCHLLLEKPISHSLEGVVDLFHAVQRGGGKVLVGFQFRYHTGLQQVKKLLAEGAIGRPVSVRAHWGEYLPSWHPWEDYRQGYSARPDLGGGVILTLSHPLDYLRWLLGEITDVWAFTGQISDLELQVEDTAEIGLRFAAAGDARGALGSLHLDYIQRPPSHHLEIPGTQGMLRWDNADGAVHLYQVRRGAGLAPSAKLASNEPAWQNFPAPQGFERNDMFLAQMRHFLAVANGEETPRCTLQDGLKALQLALAAHESQQKGKVISLQTVL